MCAVVEPAVARSLGDIGKHLLQCIFGVPQPNRSYTGGVDQQPATREPQEVTRDGGVAAFGVAGTDRLGFLYLVIEKRVDQRALARARLTQERARSIRRQELANSVETLESLDTGDDHLDSGCHRLDDRHELARLVRGGHIGFGENDDGSCAGVPGKNQEPLQLSRPEWAVESVHQKHNIDVGRQRLLLLTFPWIAAHELGSSWQHGRNSPVAIIVGDDLDPVTRDRRRRGLRTLRIRLCSDDAVGGDDIAFPTFHTTYPTGCSFEAIRGELRFPVGIPAEMNEFGTIHNWHPTCGLDWHNWHMDQIDDPALTAPGTSPEIDHESATTAVPLAPRGASWLAGLLGAAIALSVGELLARFSERLISLVIGVGDVFVDITPGEVVATSINNVGSAQKPILLWSIVIGALLIGGAVGLRARVDRRVVPAAFALFGLFGGFATARSPLTSGALSWLVAVVAAAAGAATVLFLLAVARRSTEAPTTDVITPGAPLSQATNRRHILAYGGAAIGAVAITSASRVGRTSAAERARDEILTNAANTTSVPAADGVTVAPRSALPSGTFDDVAGLTSYITPISPEDEFYLIDTALQKPQVNPATWTLTIDGEYVTNPVTYTYDELMAREMIETEVTLSCVSNPVGGDLVGNAVWRGIPLSELFEEAGIIDPTDAQTQVFSRSVDGFTCGFPTPLAYDGRTAMLALEMNGEPLPISHGFPARIVVAGLYGYVSATKWVETISITDWIGVDGFWMPRGWSKDGPIKTQSRIDVPRNQETVSAGLVNIGGIAWSPTIGIEKVEISLGEDDVWQEVELGVVESNETWLQWKYDWQATPGDWLIRVRATDSSGFTQSPISVAPAPNGAEGYHTIFVRVE